MKPCSAQYLVQEILNEFSPGPLKADPGAEFMTRYEINFAATQVSASVSTMFGKTRIEIDFVVAIMDCSHNFDDELQLANAESFSAMIPFRLGTVKLDQTLHAILLAFSTTSEFLTEDYLRTVFMEGFDSTIELRSIIMQSRACRRAVA